jgi:cell division protein FtsB
MIGLTIVLTFIITTLGLLVVFQRIGTLKVIKENDRILRENEVLRRQVGDLSDQVQFRREVNAYDRGLYDARKTDTLYRSMLKNVSAENRNATIMNGTTEGGK